MLTYHSYLYQYPEQSYYVYKYKGYASLMTFLL